MKKSIKVITTLLWLVFATSMQAQEPNPNSSEFGYQRTSALDKSLVTPNSPEASSLGQYGEFNVSPYTGLASLQIPILSVQGKTTSVPINLLYSGTAIKVDNREGWTGVSWNLTSNFAVTRSVVANPDLDLNYYSKKDTLNPQTYTDLFVENELLYDISRGCVESQPDNFYVSTPSGSAKFYISPHKEIIQKEHQNLKINATFEADGDISKFTVSDDNGVSYVYSAVEETNLFIDDQFGGDIAPCYLNYRFNSAWHLTEIIGTNGVEKFLFDYQTASTQYALDINPFYYQSVTYNPQNIMSPNCCGNTNESTTSGGSTNTSFIIGRKHLNNIKYVLGTDTLERVIFESTSIDGDCPYANSTDRRLNRIRQLKGSDGLVNFKDFELKYYEDNGGCSSINRLLLKSVQELSPDATETVPPYEFDYDTSLALPPYITNQLDHFGYWNLNSQNTLIPKITPQGGTVLNSSGANRNPNFTRTKVGILEEVTYPTGGKSRYTWEAHTVAGLGTGNYYDYAPTQDPAIDRNIGGLRIASIENLDCDGTLLLKKSWKYEKSGTNPSNKSSSGLILNEIRYTNTVSYDYCPVQILGGGGSCNTDYICHRTNISATSKSTLGTIKGSHAAYSRVEEIIEANDNSNETSGKTVYFYKNQSFNQFGVRDNVENGLLTRQEVYDADDKLIDKTDYIYSTDEGEIRKRESFFGFRVIAKDIQDNKIFLCKNTSGQFFWTEESGNVSCNEQKVFRTKFERRFTEHQQRWVYPSEKTNTRYFYHANGTLTGQVSTTTDYIYGDTTTNQPTETIITNSDGKVYRNTTQFVNSFDSNEYPVPDDSGGFVVSMRKKGMTSFPLVEAQYVDGQLVYKTKLNYKLFGTLALPHKMYEEFSGTGDLLVEVFDTYDGVGNIRQGHSHYEHSSGESQPTVMVYNNSNSTVAAEVKNAVAGEVAYTGFETTETYQGGWTVPDMNTDIKFDGTSIGGKGNFRITTFTTKNIHTLINAGTYILSYYTTDTVGVTASGTDATILSTKISNNHLSNWNYVEHKLQVNSRSTVNVQLNHWDGLDELRLYPCDALMTTFNSDKDNYLVNSVMDNNSLPTSFEYDKLLRLTGVRNFDEDYVSVNDYLYRTQNDCNTDNSVRNWSVIKEGQTDANIVKGLGSGDVIKVYNYYDGIGRRILTSSVGTSPTGKDQVKLTQYDKFGRLRKDFITYTATTNGGTYRSNALAEQQSFISNEYGASNANFGVFETELELSPLNRVFKNIPAGSNFNSNPTETEYAANGANEVRNFHAINGWYSSDDLFKVVQKDEDKKRIVTYSDKIGRIIMKDQEGSKTYFLYNDDNLLEQIIQPEAAQKGHDTPMLTNLNQQIEDGSFLYTYDTQLRLKTKVVPNCAAYTYHYDDLDRLIMTEDGNGFKTFTKYDKLGRVVMNGRYKGSAEPSTSQVVFEERSNTAPHYYTTNQSFPNDGNIDIYVVNYYDNYDVDFNNSEDVVYESEGSGQYDQDYPFVRGLSVGSKVGILNNDNSAPSIYLTAYSFYDKFRRLVHSRKENHLNGEDKAWNKFNFVGWKLRSKRVHNTDIAGQVTTKTINERSVFDHIGRELQYYHQVDNEAEQLVSEMVYNERDELESKKLGNTTGNNFLQTVDYSYNIRKWLTAINNPKSLGTDLFGMNLIYEATLGTPNHNGNVSSVTWTNSSDEVEKTYNYSYDNLNRLTGANYSQVSPNANSLTTTFNQYNTAYTYDGNGNIKTLTRNGLTQSGTFGQIDDLDYTYANDGALTNLSESSEQTNGFKSKTVGGAGAYTYDSNGNMITDAHKGVTVEYNFLNLPTKVTKAEGTIEWIYDAVGSKLSKSVTTKHLTINDNPILSKEYKAEEMIESNGVIESTGNVIFTAGDSIVLKAGFTAMGGSDFLARILAGNVIQVRDYCGGLEYFESTLESIYLSDGRVFFDGGNTERQYVISDYLDNSRVLFKDDNGAAKVLEDYNYYPMGSPHSETSNLKQNYTFGGKEEDLELDLDWLAFPARCYDAWAGRWMGIDVLAQKKSGFSPYAYVLGNPLRFTDPTGMIEEDENGLMSVSTSKFGRDVTGGENSGQVGREVRGEVPDNSNQYFDAEGNHLGSGGNSSEIRIVRVGKEGDKKSFKKNSKLLKERPVSPEAIAKVGKFFLNKLGFDDLPIQGRYGIGLIMGVTSRDGSDDVVTKEGIVQTNPILNVFLTPSSSYEGLGFIDKSLTYTHNFINTLYHESLHFKSMYPLGDGKFLGGFADNNDIGYANHLNVYWMQINHSTYQHTTRGYKVQTMKFAREDYYEKIRNKELKAHFNNLFKFE